MRKLKLEELNRLSVSEFQSKQKIPVIAVLDNIRSAVNVGSVFRTADAFAIEKIILCGISATPPNREITKTAIGATESVHWEHIASIKDAVAKLKADGYKILGLDKYDYSFEKIAVIFGNEVDGISDEILEDLDLSIEIPQNGTKHSLNVSVCAGIILWELSNRMQQD